VLIATPAPAQASVSLLTSTESSAPASSLVSPQTSSHGTGIANTSGSPIGLDEVVENVVFDHESGRSKLEMSYFTFMHEDDRIGVIIEGHGKNSAAFSFRHYRYWVEKEAAGF
jgi:hypothetical protein